MPHIPNVAIIQYTSNIPQIYIANYGGLYVRLGTSACLPQWASTGSRKARAPRAPIVLNSTQRAKDMGTYPVSPETLDRNALINHMAGEDPQSFVERWLIKRTFDII